MKKRTMIALSLFLIGLLLPLAFSGRARAEETNGVSITGQPASASAVAGNTVKFTVKASGSGLQYQWQYRTSSSGTWKNSTSATTGR